MENLPYIEEYNKFVETYKSGQVTGEQVGEVIARLAQYFGKHNNELVAAEKRLFITAADIAARVDDTTGKAITSSKAEIFICATEEHFEVEKLKAHVENIEQYINALKALQKGILQEYAGSAY